jgi:hypothetical protein
MGMDMEMQMEMQMEMENQMVEQEHEQDQQSTGNVGTVGTVGTVGSLGNEHEAQWRSTKHLWQEAAASATLKRLRHRIELDSTQQMQSRMGYIRAKTEIVRGEVERIESAAERDEYLLKQVCIYTYNNRHNYTPYTPYTEYTH